MSTVYRHYGIEKFDRRKLKKIRNQGVWNKPSGGFWASPIDAKRSWKDWCEGEDFRLDTFRTWVDFTLKDESKILKIHNKWDMKRILKNEFMRVCFDASAFECVLDDPVSAAGLWDVCIDFEKIAEKYDAIEVYAGSNPTLYWAFYGWDCDSILVLNTDKIVVV